jgi:hypothetical protein
MDLRRRAGSAVVENHLGFAARGLALRERGRASSSEWPVTGANSGGCGSEKPAALMSSVSVTLLGSPLT